MTRTKEAVLLVNLGSPDSPSVPDVRRYLGEFLMDGRVIDVPYPIRKMIVGGFILPFRPKKSAHAYETIWWQDGSPLIVISARVQSLLAERLEVPVELAMRYGNPSIPSAVKSLMARGVDRVLMIPLYPHYAMSTIESSVVAMHDAMRRAGAGFELKVFPPYYDEPMYIDALADSAREFLEKDYDHLLVSYHGLPERHLRKTDPTGKYCLSSGECCAAPPPEVARVCYRHQVYRTTEAFATKLGLPADKYSVSFQSRLGKDSWLKPFTADEVQRLAAAGVKKLVMMCPAFVSDCLETLEEIGIGIREDFMAAGGESFTLIPCLNDLRKWIDTLESYCERELSTTHHAPPPGGPTREAEPTHTAPPPDAAHRSSDSPGGRGGSSPSGEARRD